MRAYRLLQVALQAETLRWKAMASRMMTRVAMACVALLCLIGAMIFVHLAAWIWLRSAEGFSDVAAAGSLAGADFLIAALFLVLAARSNPSRTELEALEMRRRAIEGISSRTSLMAVLIPLIRMAYLLLRRPRD